MHTDGLQAGRDTLDLLCSSAASPEALAQALGQGRRAGGALKVQLALFHSRHQVFAGALRGSAEAKGAAPRIQHSAAGVSLFGFFVQNRIVLWFKCL